MSTHHKNKQQRKKNNQSRKSRRSIPRGVTSRHAQMVADPCNGPIVRGMYGTDRGLFGKFHSTLTTSTAGQTCGYVLWFPDYADNTAGTRANLVGGCFDNSAINGPNSTVDPAFNGAPWVLNKTFRVTDPAADFTNSTTCSDMRTHGACMRMRFIGRKFDARGEVAFIQNLSINELVTEGVTLRAPSVDNLFKSSSYTKRFGDDQQEIIYQPTANSEEFQSETVSPLLVGTPSSTATVASDVGLAQNPTCFGFAWRGFDSSVDPLLVFDFYKVVEWRPSPESGLTIPTPDHHGDSKRESVLSALQKQFGINWTVNPQAVKVAGAAVKAVYNYYTTRKGQGRLH